QQAGEPLFASTPFLAGAGMRDLAQHPRIKEDAFAQENSLRPDSRSVSSDLSISAHSSDASPPGSSSSQTLSSARAAAFFMTCCRSIAITGRVCPRILAATVFAAIGV